ncbi:MAG: GNAT family N-acetyltransferase [Eudoraea sp.]|nr:GNAT family N-acetyltransferase [Eudoraea sp.]NNJ40946.1 GNAT family N-acetyltransferase [Eudoraea sp.]
MEIVRASAADIPFLAPLFDQYRVFYKQPSDLEAAAHFLSERFQRNESVVFLARKKDLTLGFTQLFPSFSSVSMKYIYILNDLYVAPEYRHQGVGKALLLRAQRYCQEKGFGGLALETAIDNPAQGLYARMGWVKDTHCFHYFWKAPA